MIRHDHVIKVYYRDVDQMGIVYYSRYLEYFEEARTELLVSLGLDVPFIEKFKINKSRSKLILRNFLKQNLKNSTFKNPKKGFTVPMAGWIKNDLKNLVLDTLSENTISRLGLFNYNYLYKEVIKPHLENNSNNHKKFGISLY